MTQREGEEGDVAANNREGNMIEGGRQDEEAMERSGVANDVVWGVVEGKGNEVEIGEGRERGG